MGTLNRVLLITRSWMCVYPANKAMTQLNQCRTDRLLSGVMQAVVCGNQSRRWSVPGLGCPVHGPFCDACSQAGMMPATSAPTPVPGLAGWRSRDPGRAWPWTAEQPRGDVPCHAWDSPGPSTHQSPGSRQWQRHQTGHGQGEVDPAKDGQLILIVMIMTLNNNLWNL